METTTNSLFWDLTSVFFYKINTLLKVYFQMIYNKTTQILFSLKTSNWCLPLISDDKLLYNNSIFYNGYKVYWLMSLNNIPSIYFLINIIIYQGVLFDNKYLP
jgi:hypothetical protein